MASEYITEAVLNEIEDFVMGAEGYEYQADLEQLKKDLCEVIDDFNKGYTADMEADGALDPADRPNKV